MAKLHDRMFISQPTLEQWVDQGGVTVNELTLTLLKSGYQYSLEPAVKMLSVVSGDTASGLIGKVLSEHRIVELGGEILGDSVLFGETAFQVETGYIGTLRGLVSDKPRLEAQETREQKHG